MPVLLLATRNPHDLRFAALRGLAMAEKGHGRLLFSEKTPLF
jgi:hypothetical protein